MIDWIYERSFIYMLSVVLIPLVGLLLVCWGLRGKRRYRWPRIVPGVALMFLWACLPMEDWFFDIDTWFLEDGIYLFGVAAGLLIGPVLVCWGVRGDRSKGRVRCPKCWYDMRGTVPRLECPECGHDAQQARRLYRTRRGRRRIVSGLMLVLLTAYPLVIIAGWLHEQSTMWWYEIASFGSHTMVGPAWLVDRLPDELARYFERIDSLGIDDPAELAACRSLRYLRSIGSGDEPVTDADLVHVRGLSNLRDLHLWRTRVTDAGLVHLKGLTNLEALSLSDTQVTGKGFVHLQGLSNLEELSLSRTPVTDAGLVHLRGLTKLKRMWLDETKITGVGFEHLKGLSQLENLELRNTPVTDAGLIHLSELSNLEGLGLKGTRVTDAGLVGLRGLSKLKRLDLSNTQVTGVGFEHLKGLSNLKPGLLQSAV